jgi:hypothetical protein
VHNIAGVYEAKANAPTDRCGNVGISELEFGVVDLRLIRRNRSIKLADQRGLRVELLLRNDAFLEKKLESLEIHFGVPALGLIFGELPLGLFKLDLEGTGVDLREKIPSVDELTFLERDTDKLAINTAADGYGVESGDRTEAVKIDWQVAALGGGNDNRHYEAARVRPAPPLSSGTWRG